MNFVIFIEDERMGLGKHNASPECCKCFAVNNDNPFKLSTVLLQFTVILSYLLFKILFRVILYGTPQLKTYRLNQ